MFLTPFLLLAAVGAPHSFSIGPNDFLLDGQAFQIRCGEIHAARVPKEYWRHRLQMARAMGLNTVCAYLFWNLHEPRAGEFNWAAQADAAAFCRLAQEEGLWVILRPGPYACAEWEMGGFPFWLLKHEDIQLRSRDVRYLDAARRYLHEVGRVLGPLQITRGGPILMVQVENEYGFYGKDAQYMGELRSILIESGFDVPLFACNPPYALRNGYRDDLFPVVNFGSDPANGFKALREVLPTGPLMCGEFYPGWFDTWGQPHHLGKTEQYLADLEYMLKAGASFSIYMAHGGTTFGFWTGADRPFKPDTSSYDYDAPISEAGGTTDKFFKTRELFAKYLLPGESLPDPPAPNPLISIAPIEVQQCAPLLANLPAPRLDAQPRNFEQYDQDFGCILYRVQVPAGPQATLEAKAIHDIGQVFLDGQRIGFTDRRHQKYAVDLPARTAEATLDILVEAMGRVNFGAEVHDRKGIHGPVTLAGKELTEWHIFNLPLDDAMLAGLRYSNTKSSGPAFYRAQVQVVRPGDCFLDMRPWGKGLAWVNGHNLGRYWNIGPQQTMYLPGVWLKPGANEIVILDLLGPETPWVAALASPILDQLRPALDFSESAKSVLQVDVAEPVHTGSFAPGAAVQEIKFASSATGRYFALESVNAHDGAPYAAIAELVLLGTDGQPLSAETWKIASVDSQETEKEDGSASNAIDGQTANFWHTQWGSASPDHPHLIVIDLGKPETISGLRYTPRPGTGGGRIKDFRTFVGSQLKPRVVTKPQAALRINGPNSMTAGNVYLLRIEAQADADKPWRYAEPDSYQVVVAGAGKLLPDPALKAMNPLTVEVAADAQGEVTVSVETSGGAAASRTFTVGPPSSPEEFVAEIDPTKVTHPFAGFGGGVLFYDNQFDITDTGEPYDWCFQDVKTAFLHLLIRPDCEPANDNDDWRTLDVSKFDFTSAARPLRIAREARKRNPDLQIYVSLYTSPAWMKSNLSTRGDGTLQEGLNFRQELAEFVFAWLKHAHEQGIPVRYLSFFNEPDWMHTQDGMYFQDLGTLADTFVDCATALDELVAADGTIKTPLQVFPEALGAGSITRSGQNTQRLKARSQQLSRVDVWGVHDYWNTSGDYWTNRYHELRAFPGVGDKPIWMTEWAQRYRHGDLDSALEYGRNILNALRSGAEAWMVFEWMHPYGNQSGLISTDWGEQTGERRFWRSKAYHVFRQIANTTPAGAQVIAMRQLSPVPNTKLEYLALREGENVLVHLVNSGSDAVRCTLQFAHAAPTSVACWETTPFVNLQQRDQSTEPLQNEGERASHVVTVPPYSLVTLAAVRPE
ncbi:MAG: beta-galactosidase [Pirellulaceae bacterium]